VSRSRDLATGPLPEPYKSGLHPPIACLHFPVILSSTSGSSKWPRFFDQNFMCIFLTPFMSRASCCGHYNDIWWRSDLQTLNFLRMHFFFILLSCYFRPVRARHPSVHRALRRRQFPWETKFHSHVLLVLAAGCRSVRGTGCSVSKPQLLCNMFGLNVPTQRNGKWKLYTAASNTTARPVRWQHLLALFLCSFLTAFLPGCEYYYYSVHSCVNDI
jgi:hypothetical protein